MIRLLTLVCFLSLMTPAFGQKANYVWQNSKHSFGAFTDFGLNIHNQKGREETKTLGYQTNFGMVYLNHKNLRFLEAGISYGNQWLTYKKESVLDSFSAKYGLSLNTLGFPLGIGYKFTQNKRRSYLSTGIHPAIVLSSKLNALESSPQDNQALTIIPQSSNQLQMRFSAYARFGKAYDLSRGFMLRVELQYQFSTLNIREENYTSQEFGVRFLFMNHN